MKNSKCNSLIMGSIFASGLEAVDRGESNSFPLADWTKKIGKLTTQQLQVQHQIAPTNLTRRS